MNNTALESWLKLVNDSPEEKVLFFPDGRGVSRKLLNDESDLLCNKWLDSGLKPQCLLALNLPNGVEWMVAFLACLKSKIIVVPLDPGFEENEIVGLLSDLRIQALWNGDCLKQYGHVKPRLVRSPDIVLGKLSSGSTGKPKLLLFSDKEMVTDGENLINAMGIRKMDINLGMIPWGHSYGLGNIVYPLLIQGTRSTWVSSVFPSDIADTCFRVKATLFPAVPTLLRALTKSDCSAADLSSLRLVISAGARLEPEIAQQFKKNFGLVPRNFYGSTETGGICYDKTGEAALTGRSVGKPIGGVQILEGRGRRFYVHSGAVYSTGNRYKREGEASKHLTGDYGYIDAIGELVLENRAKGIIKIAGRRIDPANVELRLKAIAGVSQSIVFGLEMNNDTILAAAFETELRREVLLKEIRSTLPIRLRPKKIRCFELFPVTRRGKVNLTQIKQALK